MPKDFQYHVVINRNREYILDTLSSSAVLPEQSLLLCGVAQTPKVEKRNVLMEPSAEEN